MQSTTKRNLTLVFIIAVVVLCVAYTIIKFLPHSKKVSTVQQEEPAKPYYLFTESDNGTSTQVVVGGTVIMQLSETSYGEPVTVYDADGKAITPTIEHYKGYIVISMSVPTTTEMTASAHAISSTTDFSLILKPLSLH